MTNQTIVTVTVDEARAKARELYQAGDEAGAMEYVQAIIQADPSSSLMYEIELMKKPATKQKVTHKVTRASYRVVKRSSAVAAEGKDMVKEIAHDGALIARDVLGLAGRLVGGTLNVASRTLGVVADEFNKAVNNK